jgi:hypothetical protein
MRSTMIRTVLSFAAIFACAACGASSDAAAPAGTGRLQVLLTDAPFPFDSVKSVDVFVVRVDARVADASDSEAADGADAENHGGWITVAEPNASVDLLALRDGKTSLLGDAALANGTYEALRLIIDTDKSTVTLQDGTVLGASGSPGIKFPSAGKVGLKIQLAHGITVKDGTTKILVDFDVGQSFVLRGNSLAQLGLLFKPVIKATLVP